MDAVAGAVEADPGDTNRIVGAGRDAQALADGGGFGIIGEQVGIKGVIGVFGPDNHVQGFAHGAFAFIGRDGTGKMRDEPVGRVIGPEAFLAQADFNPSQRGQALSLDVGNGQDSAWGRVRPGGGRIQATEGGAVEVEFFSDEFLDRGEAQAIHAGAFEPGIGIG